MSTLFTVRACVRAYMRACVCCSRSQFYKFTNIHKTLYRRIPCCVMSIEGNTPAFSYGKCTELKNGSHIKLENRRATC